MVTDYTTTFVAVLATITGMVSATHALFNKRDPRSALGWCAVCLMTPFIGAVLYVLFGINRVASRARRLQLGERRLPQPMQSRPWQSLHGIPGRFAGLAQLSEALQQWPLTAGNRVTPLYNGEGAYPEMLAVIRQARSRVSLGTYIFDSRGIGLEFVNALAAAVARGVDVRVLIDGVGEWYSWPHAGRRLRGRAVPVRTFAPPRLFPPAFQINLRNHRKILVADGRIGFAGGINIGDRHLSESRSGQADVHFRFDGPVVTQLEEVFFEDWERAGGDRLDLPEAHPAAMDDNTRCRVLTDSPNEDMDKLTVVLTAAISLARRRVLIMNPYFLPPRELIGALVSAALRGVEVSIILPGRSNLPYVHWATRNMLWELLRWGVRVYYQPAPFNHSKLFIVDEDYVQVGSANLDPRSLRLNFELMVEVLDRRLARTLAGYCLAARSRSREVTLDEVDSRSFPERFRDSIAWLFSPYL
jgi:cardiolipin synthase